MTHLTQHAAFAFAALPLFGGSASAQPVTTVSPFRSPAFQTPLPNSPYWTTPHWTTPYWSSQSAAGQTPGAVSAQRPFANPSPTGGPSCVAPGYTCPVSAPATTGQPCICPANNGGTVDGVVR